MGAIVETRGTSVWFVFKSHKQLERERQAAAKDREIEAIKAETAIEAAKATRAMTELNKMVEAHGISGLIYFSTSKKRGK